MSLKSLEARKLATASVIALSALGVSASAAQADIEKNLEYTCKYPLVDKKPLSINVKSNIPQYAKLNEQQPAFVVNAIATAKDGTSEAIDTLDAYKLTGISEARASLVFPSGFVQGNLKVPLTVAPYIRQPNAPIPDPLVLTATGKTPSVNLDELGPTKIRLDKISLNLAAFYQDGTPINVKKLLTDFDGVAVTDSDGDVNTFDVYCKLNAGEDPVIATIQVTADGLPPVGPDTTKPSVPGAGVYNVDTDIGINDLTVRWGASTDEAGGSGLKGYNVEYETETGTDVAFVPAGTTFKKFTGLGSDSGYYFWISAVDNAGNESAQSEEFLITNRDGAPLNVPPSPPKDVKAVGGTKSVDLSWGAATDVDGTIAGYNVYLTSGTTPLNGATKITGTSYKATGLADNTKYSFVVEAIDDKGAAVAADAVDATTSAVVIPNVAPSKVVGVTAGTSTETTIPVSWTAATDSDGTVAKYNVYVNGSATPAKTVTTTSTTLDGLTADTTYSITVEAVDNKDAKGAKSDAISKKTAPKPIIPNVAPSKVTGVKAGTTTETTIPLSWTAATDSDGTIKAYNVYVNGSATPAKTVTGTSTTLDGLTADTTYSITVEAVDNQDAKGAKSDAVSAKTAPKPIIPNVAPSKVTGVKAGTTTETTIPVSWTAATDSDGTVAKYNVYVNGSATPAKTVTTTSTTLDGLTADTTYSITVEAVDNKDAKGAKSDAVSAKTAPKPIIPNVAPSKVTGVKAGTTTETTIPVSWTAATDSDGTVAKYNVYVNGSATPAKTVTTTSTTLDGLTADTTYSITVEAVDNKDAKGAKSDAVSAKTAPKPIIPNVAPSKVTGVKAGTTTETTIPLSWTAATDSDGTIKAYNVYVNGSATPAKTVTTTSTTLDGLTADTTYSITVEAVDNKDAKGAKSDAVSAKTAPKPIIPNVAPSKVTGVKAGTTTETTIPLSWTAATDSDGTIKAYNVYVNGSATPAKTVTGTSTTLDGLTADTTYKVTVEAVDNKDAKGAKSDELSAKTAAKPLPGNKVPVITSIIGKTAFARIGGIAIVQGTNFTGVKSVTVGGKNATASALGKDAILVILPPLAKGSYQLVVTNADGASATSAATTIKYISLF